MNTPRIRLGHPAGQTPPHIFSDFEWVRTHEKELLKQYGECSIVVYKGEVIGRGDSFAASLEDAERNLPPEMTEITPIQVWLTRPNPLSRIQPRPVVK